jgi:hypothetical protein
LNCEDEKPGMATDLLTVVSCEDVVLYTIGGVVLLKREMKQEVGTEVVRATLDVGLQETRQQFPGAFQRIAPETSRSTMAILG